MAANCPGRTQSAAAEPPEGDSARAAKTEALRRYPACARLAPCVVPYSMPRRFLARCALLAASILALPTIAHAQADSGQRGGKHDFDWEIGTWKTSLKRLQNPLSGSTTWLEYEGTSVVTKVWDGKANLVELDATGPSGRIVPALTNSGIISSDCVGRWRCWDRSPRARKARWSCSC